MRLKKHNSAAALHSQLSAILEKLMISAVEEIKELVFDFCEEISREKAHNSDVGERTRNEEEERLFETPASFYREPQNAASESYEQMTPTSSREDAKEKHISEQSYVQFPDTKEFPISGQETLSLNCKLEPTATSPENPITNTQEEGCSQDGSKQSSFEPPGDSKDHLIDYNSTAEAQSTPFEDLSTNQGHSRDAEFHIKQEEEMPSFDSGRNTDDIHSNLEQGMSFDSFHARPEEMHELPLENPAGPILDFFPVSLPDQQMQAYFSNQETQFSSHPESRLPFSKQVKKYTCDFCSKKFSYPSDLKHHRLWHTRERTHVCRICGKAFVTKSHLRRHEIMHLDVQPSVCQICGYRTSRLCYLKEHMKIHAKNHV